MDDSKGSYKLGLFVVSALISLFVVLFILEGRSLFEPKMIVETYFDESVSGLDGAPVRFRGITAGRWYRLSSPMLSMNRMYQEKTEGHMLWFVVKLLVLKRQLLSGT